MDIVKMKHSLTILFISVQVSRSSVLPGFWNSHVHNHDQHVPWDSCRGNGTGQRYHTSYLANIAQIEKAYHLHAL